MSSTRAPGLIMSAMSCRSTRMPLLRRMMSLIGSARGQAAMLGAAIEEAVQGGGEFRLVEQEGVMALVALDLDEADIGGDRVERVHDGAALGRGEQPVGGERGQAEAHLGVAKGVGQHAAMLGREVEI